MKRTIRLLAVLAMSAALAFAACGKDDDNDNNGGNTGMETAEWVDLGLPSGLLWAKCNLGATTPEGHGDYYAWGETATKEVYNWSTYKYCTASAEDTPQTLTKYITSTPWQTSDNLTTLQAIDDVATQKLGDGARMPTADEWYELINNTTAEWTAAGRKFTAANGNSLFLPAAGNRWGSELGGAGSVGNYWSSSLYADFPYCAWTFYFNSVGQDMCGDPGRGNGFSVRAVRQN